jgi:hypothetical protein
VIIKKQLGRCFRRRRACLMIGSATSSRRSRLAEIPITLRGLPEEFGVSHESVRLIGVRALENVQTTVKTGVAAIETLGASGCIRAGAA